MASKCSTGRGARTDLELADAGRVLAARALEQPSRLGDHPLVVEGLGERLRARPVGRVDDGMRATMVGHAALLVQAAGINILTDPVWSDRASPFRRIGPRRVTAPGIAFDDLPPIDIVVLSHGHYDHCDVATLRRLHERDAPLMALPLGNDAIVRAAVPGARCVAGDWWQRIELRDGIATTPVNDRGDFPLATQAAARTFPHVLADFRGYRVRE